MKYNLNADDPLVIAQAEMDKACNEYERKMEHHMELENRLAMEAEDVRNDEELIERVAKAIERAYFTAITRNDFRLEAKAAINAFVDYYDPPQS